MKESYKLKQEKQKALEKAEIRKIKYEIDEMNSQYKKTIPTTKILMAFILINCTVVELYAMILMLYLQNLEPLSALIGAVITESLSYAIYCAKSYNENKSKATLAFDREKFEASLDQGTVEEETPVSNDDDYKSDGKG